MLTKCELKNVYYYEMLMKTHVLLNCRFDHINDEIKYEWIH